MNTRSGHLLWVSLALLPCLGACNDDGGGISSGARDTGKVERELDGISTGTIGSESAEEGVRALTSELADNASYSAVRGAADPRAFATGFVESGGEFGGVRVAPGRAVRAAARRAGFLQDTEDEAEDDDECEYGEENSSGTTVSWTFTNEGCASEEEEGLFKITAEGTNDEAAGHVNVVMEGRYNLHYADTDEGMTMEAEGELAGSFLATGLTPESPSFTSESHLSITMDATFSGQGFSGEMSCWAEWHDTSSGSSSRYTFSTKEADVCGPGVFESKELMAISGEAVQNGDGTATVNATGEYANVGEDAEQTVGSVKFSGRVSVEMKDVVEDPKKCGEDEPAKSGTIILRGDKTATVKIVGCGRYEVSLQ